MIWLLKIIHSAIHVGAILSSELHSPTLPYHIAS